MKILQEMEGRERNHFYHPVDDCVSLSSQDKEALAVVSGGCFYVSPTPQFPRLQFLEQLGIFWDFKQKQRNPTKVCIELRHILH